MSLEKKRFCGACGKAEEKAIKESRNEDLGELKNCTRCRSIRYCGRSCQRSEFKKHNDHCQFIKNTIDELLKIEETYKQFKLSSTGAPQNIWETEVGDFWAHANDQFWEKSGGGPATTWPREYLKKRMRLVNSLWIVADTNLGNHETTEVIMEHLLEIIRLDISDGIGCKEMLVFMFLTLGRDEDAYGFMLWWLKNPGEPVDLEYKKLIIGQWQKEENPDKFEDLFERTDTEDFDEKGEEEVLTNTYLGFKLGLLAIKIRNVIELEELDMKKTKFDKRMADARPESTASKLRDSGIFMDCAHLFIRGEQQQHERKLEDQYDHIERYLEMINEHNPTVLPALVEPKQIQSLKESTDGITSGGVSEAREVLRYSLRYFHRLSTQSGPKANSAKKIIAKFLYPHHEEGRPYPKYDISSKK